ncbi:hypothetical protein [Halolamina salifodinae]|uniref:Uncharacterized protein n=1 Tax=Halolamina salifodinae TaxID=1202767 RepID=A0A8T4GTD9_9EURY|nr:hypothetical protein [Halolamina salifodinae]MBP1986126.1 hypothetical protein [Halolamina salifodinae]
MQSPDTGYSVLILVLGLLYAVYPGEAAWLRYVLKKGTTRNVTPPADTVNLFRLLGILLTIVALVFLSPGF